METENLFNQVIDPENKWRLSTETESLRNNPNPNNLSQTHTLQTFTTHIPSPTRNNGMKLDQETEKYVHKLPRASRNKNSHKTQSSRNWGWNGSNRHQQRHLANWIGWTGKIDRIHKENRNLPQNFMNNKDSKTHKVIKLTQTEWMPDYS
jgi:hypothetical protein